MSGGIRDIVRKTEEVAQVAWMDRVQIKALFELKMFVGTLEYFFSAKNENQIVPQVGEQFKMVCNKVFMIPWGHIKLLP